MEAVQPNVKETNYRKNNLIILFTRDKKQNVVRVCFMPEQTTLLTSTEHKWSSLRLLQIPLTTTNVLQSK